MSYELSPSVSIALLGDIIQTRSIKKFKEDRFLELLNLLRSCDAVLGNLEAIYNDWEMSYGSSLFTYQTVVEPELLDELKWLGVSAVGAAMNHAYDCGEAGLLALLSNCKKYRIPVAGMGKSLGEAREAIFVETSGGRIALLAGTTTAWIPEGAYAGKAGAGIPG